MIIPDAPRIKRLRVLALIAALTACAEPGTPTAPPGSDPNITTLRFNNGQTLSLDETSHRLLTSSGRSMALTEANYHATLRAFHAIQRGDILIEWRLSNERFRQLLEETPVVYMRAETHFLSGNTPLTSRSISTENLELRRTDYTNWDNCQVHINAWRTAYNEWVAAKQDYADLLYQAQAAQDSGDTSKAQDFAIMALVVAERLVNLENTMLLEESFRESACDGLGGITTATGTLTEFVPGFPIALLLAANATVHCESGYGTFEVYTEGGIRLWHWEGQMTGCYTVDQS